MSARNSVRVRFLDGSEFLLDIDRGITNALLYKQISKLPQAQEEGRKFVLIYMGAPIPNDDDLFSVVEEVRVVFFGPRQHNGSQYAARNSVTETEIMDRKTFAKFAVHDSQRRVTETSERVSYLQTQIAHLQTQIARLHAQLDGAEHAATQAKLDFTTAKERLSDIEGQALLGGRRGKARRSDRSDGKKKTAHRGF